jgi:hypothetical protein
MIRAIPIQEAVGCVLAHDITRIVPGREKGPAFKKGHIIRAEEIPEFLEIGKEHIYVLDLEPGMLHENEAAERLSRAAAGSGIRLSAPSEGRVNLIAETNGLLVVDVEALARINSIENIVFATLHGHQPVHADQPLAGTRVVPLIIAEDPIRRVEQICAAQSARPPAEKFFFCATAKFKKRAKAGTISASRICP